MTLYIILEADNTMKHINICNIYISCWLLYFLQGPLNIQGNIVMQFLLIAILGISWYYVYLANSKYALPSYLRFLNLLIIMFTFYGVILILSGDTLKRHGTSLEVINSFEYLKAIYLSLLPIYPFYVFSRKGKLTESLIRKWAIVFFVFATIMFLYWAYVRRVEALLKGSIYEETTNNYGYMFLSLIAITCFFKKKIIVQFALLAYCMAFIIVSMKRGAILIGALCLIVYLISTLKSANRKQRKLLLFVFSLLIIAGFYFIMYYLNTSDYFNHRMDDTVSGNSSGRDDIYSTYLNYFLHESSIIGFLVGNGAYGTLKLFGGLAHNDWLEISINQGLFGIIMYITYWIVFLKNWRRIEKRSEERMAVGLVLLVAFLKTFISMSYDDMGIYDTMIIGFCFSQIKRKKMPIYENNTSSKIIAEINSK